MGFWNNALAIEYTAQQELRLQEEAVGTTFFDPQQGFKPNAGGQNRFFEIYPLQQEAPEPRPEQPRWLALIGGIGSGKTKCGAAWVISQAYQYPKDRFLIIANSFPQLYQSTLVTLVETCREYGVYLEPYRDSVEENAIAIANRRRCYIGEHRAFVRVLSMGSFLGRVMSARGQELQKVWADESCFSPEQGFLVVDGRLRSSHGAFCSGVITSSPNGFNWVYDKFADPTRSDELKKLYWMIPCPTSENVKHLGEAYISSLYANYTTELAQSELLGLFKANTTSGLVCGKYFNRSIHALSGEDADLLAYDPTQPLRLAFDFNYSPAVCLLSQIRRDEIHVFKEFYLLDSDLWALMDEIEEWIVANKPQDETVYLYGDASGNNRSVLSRQTAWDIVFDKLRKTGLKLHRRFPNANGRVNNRINSMNCLLKANRFYVHKDCKELIKDLETVAWDSSQIDKSDTLRSHLLDAITYEVEAEFPYRNIARPSVGKKALPGVSS